MSISYPTTMYSSYDRQVQSLMRLKEQLQERIGEIKESKNDLKGKESVIKNLQEQIKKIDIELHKLKIEKIKTNSEEEVKKQRKKYLNEEENSESTLDSTYLISAETTYSQLKTMNTVRIDLLNQARLASSSGKYPQAARGIMDKVYKLEANMAEKIKDINEDLKESSDHQEGVNKKNKDNKIKEIDHDSNSEKINVEQSNEPTGDNTTIPLEHIKIKNQSSNDTDNVETQRIDIKI